MYLNEFDFHLDAEQEIEIGFKGYIDTYCSWCILGPVTLWQYETSDYAEDYNKKLSDAQAALNNNIYTNVKGSEKKALEQAINFTPNTIDDYINGSKALNDATSAFIAAKDAYDVLTNEIAKAKRFGLDVYSITEETTAAIAVEKVKEIKVAVFNKVKTDYPTPIQLGEWTMSGDPTASNHNQHWDGTTTSTYLEQKNDDGQGLGWNSANGWDITFSQDIKLPAGKYVFKMTGRRSDNVTMSLLVEDKEADSEIGTVNDFPVGDTGLGVNKNGETSFDPADAAGFANDGNGRGWEWRYVPFTLDGEKAITIMINAKTSKQYQWCSFCNYSVVATADNTFAALIAYNQKKDAAKTAIEEHPNVKGKELADLQALINEEEPSDLAAITAATTKIEEATAAYLAAEAGWTRYATATEAAKEAEVEYTDISNDNTKTAENAIAAANGLFGSSLKEAQKAISTEDKTLGFDADEWTLYLIQPSITYLNTLLAENGTDIDADKVAAAEATAMKDAVVAIKGWKANEGEVNAVANGNFAITDATATGWKCSVWSQYEKNRNGYTSEGNWWSFLKNGKITYGELDNFKLTLKPNTVYYISFRHCGWDGSNKDEGGYVSVLNTKNEGLQTTNYDKTDSQKAEKFVFKTGTELSDYILTIGSGGRCTITDIVIKKAEAEAITIDEAETYTPEPKLASVTVVRTFVAGWNGLVLPFDMTVKDARMIFNASAVKEFTGITADNNGITLNFADATEIKAGKPVMIKFDAVPVSNTCTFSNCWLPGTALTGVSQEAGDVKITFTGTYANESLAGKVFTLINGYHFYNYDGTETTVNAKTFRAYFLNETTGEAAAKSKVIGFNIDGETTGISEVKTDSEKSDKMFDMQGRRVMTPAKGIYIKDGKKVIVK